jgi:opacity protein-like surface antigen
MNRSFDDHVKEQFSGYSPGVAPHIWENIIAKKSNKKPFGFLPVKMAAGLVIVLAGLSAGIYFLSSKNDTPPHPIVKNTTAAGERTSQHKNIPQQTGEAVQHTDENIPAPGSQATANNPGGKDRLNKHRSHTRGRYAAAIRFPGADLQGTDGQDKEANSTANDNGNSVNPVFVAYDKWMAGQQAAAIRTPGFLELLPIPCPTPEANAAGNKRYFELYAGPDHVMRSFSDSGNSDYLRARKTSTKVVFAFSAGFRYTRVFGNGMSIRTGFNYSQINEKLTYKQGNIVQLTYVINTDGDTTGTFMQTGTRYKNVVNKYRSADIPLLVGYEFGNGKLHANLNAGAIINLYSWQKGSMIDMNNNIVDITTGKDTSSYQFKTNMGVGLMGAMSVYYKLNENLHLLAEPYYRYSLSPANKTTLTLKQKYNTADLRLGVRLDF